MREPDFHLLRERLLQGGVAPKHVRRTIAELRDHHTDLFAEAFSGGCSVEDAEREASIRLGDEDSLAAEILARPELRSWAHRWPWLVYGVAPAVLFIPAFVVVAFLLVGLTGAIDVLRGSWGSPDWVRSLAGAIQLFYNFGLPLVLAGACCVVAVQRRAALRWPIIGVLVASIIGGAIQLDPSWPYGPNVHGALSIRISVPPFPGSAGTLLRAAATCALTLSPYLWWRKPVART